jgi:3-oxoadipate enol-lactonase
MISDHAEDLAGLLAQLKINTAIVIGISVGGMIAQSFAAQYPDKVRLLVLCDTGLTIGTPEGWNERIAAIKEGGMVSMADAILQRWFAPDFARMRPADYRGYMNMLVRMPVEGYIATCEAIRDANLVENARKVEARALVLGGDLDVATPPDVLGELAATLPHARIELISGAAHLPCIEQPGIMAANIDWFLQENGYA